MIQINETIPKSELFFFDTEPKKTSSRELFGKKKSLLVAVPGAFTPTCHNEHLPGFIEHKNEILKKGIDKIFFISVNDPFVMDRWSDSHNEKDIMFISDPYADFAKKLGLIIDLTQIGLGVRLSRFAMIIKDNIVESILDEKGGGLDKSSAKEVIKII